MGWSYNDAIRLISDYYGADSNIYNQIVSGGASLDTIANALSGIPGMTVDRAASGTILGYSYTAPFTAPISEAEIIASGVNSNVGTGQYLTSNNFSSNVPVCINGATGAAQGAQIAGQTAIAVADRVSLGVIGVNIGAKLGKAIDQTLYDLAPEWWDENYPTINPDTWTSIAGENELGQSFIRTLFDIDSNGNTIAYVPENMIAQTYQLLRDKAYTNDYTVEAPSTYTPDSPLPRPYKIRVDNKCTLVTSYTTQQGTYIRNVEITVPPADFMLRVRNTAFSPTYNDVVYAPHIGDGLGPYTITEIGTQSYPDGTITPVNRNLDRSAPQIYYRTGDSNTPYAVLDIPTGTGDIIDSNIPTIYINDPNFDLRGPNSNLAIRDITTAYVDGTATPSQGIPGINNIPGSTQYPPDAITGTDLETVLNQLKQAYPDLFQNPITESVIQPDGSTKEIVYYPIPWDITNPSDLTQTSPTTRENPTQNPNIEPDTATQIITNTDTQTDTGDGDGSNNPPDTGTGDAPIVPPITGTASALWSVYNPTQAELNAFGGWLWSPAFIDNLLKLFADPMQAIIGIHKVFATPATGNTQPIKCGFLTSTANAKIVTSQYSDIDCGSVNLREYFGNVFDYSPHTRIRLFLPFIGFVTLDTGEVMRGTISVTYKVDVITGACLANVSVERDSAGGILYSYGGSAIVSYPISGGSYSGLITGLLGAGLSIAGGIATGNPLAAIGGTAKSIAGSRLSVAHSGGFTGNSGAMGVKTPYIVIDRPQTNIAGNFPKYDGYGANYTTKICNMSGYVRCKVVHLSCPNAYKSELDEIETLLLGGVII